MAHGFWRGSLAGALLMMLGRKSGFERLDCSPTAAWRSVVQTVPVTTLAAALTWAFDPTVLTSPLEAPGLWLMILLAIATAHLASLVAAVELLRLHDRPKTDLAASVVAGNWVSLVTTLGLLLVTVALRPLDQLPLLYGVQAALFFAWLPYAWFAQKLALRGDGAAAAGVVVISVVLTQAVLGAMVTRWEIFAPFE